MGEKEKKREKIMMNGEGRSKRKEAREGERMERKGREHNEWEKAKRTREARRWTQSGKPTGIRGAWGRGENEHGGREGGRENSPTSKKCEAMPT